MDGCRAVVVAEKYAAEIEAVRDELPGASSMSWCATRNTSPGSRAGPPSIPRRERTACMFPIPGIETALKANWSASAIDGVTISSDGLLSDIHGSAAYRANLVKVMAQRAVTAAG